MGKLIETHNLKNEFYLQFAFKKGSAPGKFFAFAN